MSGFLFGLGVTLLLSGRGSGGAPARPGRTEDVTAHWCTPRETRLRLGVGPIPIRGVRWYLSLSEAFMMKEPPPGRGAPAGAPKGLMRHESRLQLAPQRLDGA